MNRARHIETWARLGYLARGFIYLVIGWLAIDSNRPLSAGEAVESIEQMPLGALLLALLAAGLFGYGLYRITEGYFDLDREGKDAKALTLRGANICSGLAYWGLTFIAVRAMLDGRRSSDEAGQARGSGGEEVARQVAGESGGSFLLILAALIILTVAAVQFVIAAKAAFMEEMDPGTPRIVKPLGRVGYAARGAVFLLIGWFALRAGLGGERLHGFGDALAVVRDSHPMWFKLIAAGLLVFGAVSVLMARYRRVPDADVGALARAATSNGV